MIQVPPTLLATLEATTNRPVDLYEFYLDTGTLYYADQTVEWGGRTYLPKVVSRSAIRKYMSGQFDDVTITLSNVDTTVAQAVRATDVEGRRVVIRRIDLAVEGQSFVIFDGRLGPLGAIDEETVEIRAKDILASIDFDAPARTFGTGCPWDFKGIECGYEGPETDCDKSWARCANLGNTNRFGGFRFLPHTGTFQYTEVTRSRFLLLFARKKEQRITAAFNSVDDTPYDVPVPIVYGRCEIAGIDIQHEDQGDSTKALVAFCIGKIRNFLYLKANEAGLSDWTLHFGAFGGSPGQETDPRFAATAYPYSLLAYVGLSIPSDVKTVDPAPNITALVMGREVATFDAAGHFIGTDWTDNPVWNVRDFMTLPLAQGGLGVPESLMDDVEAYRTAQYCAESIVDTTNDQKIYLPTSDVPEGFDYRRYRSTGIIGGNPEVDGPYAEFEPGVDDDTTMSPTPVNVKRFTMNVAIAKQEKAIDILYKKLLPSFRGYLTQSAAGKLQIRCERPVRNSSATAAAVAGGSAIQCSTPSAWSVGDLVLLAPFTARAEVRKVDGVLGDGLHFSTPLQYDHLVGDVLMQVAMAFDDANMLKGFAYPLSDRQSSTNRVTVKYTDAPAGFQETELRINDYDHQTQVHKVNNEDVDGGAIDSYFQAWRIGQWIRAKYRDLGKFCSLNADIKATRLEIGDVFCVSAVEAGLQCVPFMVVELGLESNDEVSVVGQLYSLAVYDDTAPRATVTVPSIFELPSAPGQAMPGNVRPIGGDAFLCEVSDLPSGDKQFSLEYDPPDPLGVFAGVYPVLVRPDGTKLYPGDQMYNGDPSAAGSSGRHGRATFALPSPPMEEAWQIALVSISSTSRKNYVPFDAPEGTPTPYRTVAVAPAAPPAIEIAPSVPTGAVAATLVDATHPVTYDSATNQTYTWVALQISVPAHAHTRKVRVAYLDPTAPGAQQLIDVAPAPFAASSAAFDSAAPVTFTVTFKLLVRDEAYTYKFLVSAINQTLATDLLDCQSDPLHVAAVGLPHDHCVTEAAIAAVSGSDPDKWYDVRMGRTSEGAPYFMLPKISWRQPSANPSDASYDPNTWYTTVTVTCVDATNHVAPLAQGGYESRHIQEFPVVLGEMAILDQLGEPFSAFNPVGSPYEYLRVEIWAYRRPGRHDPPDIDRTRQKWPDGSYFKLLRFGPPPPSSLDLLVNPGFETGDLTGWKVLTGSAVVQGSVKSAGNYAAKITGNDTRLNSTQRQCEPGETWVAKAMLQANVAPVGTLYLYVVFYGANKTSIVDAQYVAVTAGAGNTGKFGQSVVSGAAPAGTSWVGIQINQPTQLANNWYVDNVELVKQISTGPGTEPDGKGGVQWKPGQGLTFDGTGKAITKLLAGAGIGFDLSGNMLVQQADLAIANFAGNLNVSRITNLGTIAIASFSGNLDVTRITNLYTLFIANFSGNLDVSRVTSLGTLSISSFTGTLDISRVNNISSINIGTLSGTLNVTYQIADGSIPINKIATLYVNNVQGWDGAAINVGGAGLTFNGTGSLYLYNGGSVQVSPGYVWAQGGFYAGLPRVQVIDAASTGNFASLKIQGGTKIDSGGNGYFLNIYTKAEVDALLAGKANHGTYGTSGGQTVTI